MCDRAAVLHHGELVESGPVDDLFTAPRTDVTRRLLDAVLEPVAS
jgi:ABC-type dipeptide/oligopeptide/nickel transport system ATPase component